MTDPANGKSYYYVKGDTENEHDLALTGDYHGSCKVAITVAPKEAGFTMPAGSYYVNISLASPGRLGAAISGTGAAAYVASDQAKNVYVPVTVGADGKFASITRYAYVSMTGTDGQEENDVALAETAWTVEWGGSATANFVEAPNS